MVKSLVCFFFLLEAFISRTCLSHSEASGGPACLNLAQSVSLSLSLSSPYPGLNGREAPGIWVGEEI